MAEQKKRRADTSGGWLVGARGSFMAQRIITFNFVALCILLIGILFLIQTQSNAVFERQNALGVQARLVANHLQAMQNSASEEIDLANALEAIEIDTDTEIRVFANDGEIIVERLSSENNTRVKRLSDINSLSTALQYVSNSFQTLSQGQPDEVAPKDPSAIAKELSINVVNQGEISLVETSQSGFTILAHGVPLILPEAVKASVVVTTREGLLDEIVRRDREVILKVFLLAIFVSFLLSLILARTIATPIQELAEAAEARSSQSSSQGEQSILPLPKMVNRPDEIGRLASALQDMTDALYDRIDSNQRFAADVAHELKNPLASLRSATETLRIAKKPEARGRLLDVIGHDVNRMDRLVSDISNASRLDAELVREQMESFSLNNMLTQIVSFHQEEGKKRGISVYLDLPENEVLCRGLEARLAQVFVNLMGNALSFCDWGDTVRLWLRERDDQLLIAVEDTGPGIPEDSLETIFKRFYSSRPSQSFGDHSGLGLSISKQIIEAHGGLIWAENIKTTSHEDAPVLGARFVVALPT